MNLKYLLTSALLFVGIAAFSQNKSAYEIYAKNGKSSSYKKLVQEAQTADVVLFGELHNNPICHWLQLELFKDLTANNSNWSLGAEMFESDDQLLINEYVQGLLKPDQLIKEANFWPNYKTDYHPVLEHARTNQLNIVATNTPRRYASIVAKHGKDTLITLSETAKSYLCPLPYTVNYELNAYKEMLNMGHGGPHMNMSNFVDAQALKDATMAHFILKELENNKKMYHLNGAYHSKDFESIYWYLKQAKPDLKIVVINAAEQDSIDALEEEYLNSGDFILVTPTTMTKTH